MKLKVDAICQKENQIDSDGRLFTPEALKNVGKVGKKAPLLLNKEIIGEVKVVYKEDQGLVFEAEITDIELIRKLKLDLHGRAKIIKNEDDSYTIISDLGIY